MKEDCISIIIPVYNAEQYIEDTIQTIQKQTYSKWEAIFIDDASTDKSNQIIREYVMQDSRMHLITLQENKGPAIARNKGLEIAKGRYICFLDADDLWAENKLEVQITYMQKYRYAFTYTAFEFADKEGKRSGKMVRVQEVLTYKEALKDIRILTIAVMLDRKQIPKADITMPNLFNEDVATWWKILKTGKIAYGINEPLVFYRRTGKTRAANKVKSAVGRWKLYRKQEGLSLRKTIYYFTYYCINGIKKRI